MSGPLREHPYARFAHQVRKPARYMGGESGEIHKPWDAVDARMCLAFPDVYEVGMSHLGFRILYSVVNGEGDLLAERAYAPWTDMERELRKREEPLRSLESFRPLSDFDVVGFSLQFELTFANVLTMLDLGGIPLRSEDRGEGDPLVLFGGPVATHAEPMAPFADAMLVGDGEERTPEIMRLWTSLRREGLPRAERLSRLSALEGVYVPSLYEVQNDPETGLAVVTGARDGAPLPVRRTWVRDLDAFPFPADGPVATTETVFDRVSVEIARGCTEGCRFCQAGMIYRPVRERDPGQIVDVIRRATGEGGYDEASLTSLSTADYSAITPLVRDVMRLADSKKVALSVSSLRAYGLGEEVLDEMQKTRATGLTFAPEAGTQRMRDVVNKNVTEAQMMETAERVFSRGWQKMKLYFMIGLPTEEDEDVLGIVETGARALEVGRRIQGRGSPRVTVSVSNHVPKPHTPFQWCAMDDLESVRRKQDLLKDAARKTGVTLRMHDSEGTWLEGIIARGDRTLAVVIETAWRAGARFDSWEEELRLPLWKAAFESAGIDPTKFLRTIPVDARLPWDHIDVGLEPGFLAREYRKALRSRLSPPCGKAYGMFVHHTNASEAEADARKLVCYDCGVACDLGQMREERLVMLRKLGAEDASPPRPEGERRVVSPRARRKRATEDQGPVMRVRLGYRRLGRAAFSSHLDLVRLLPRLLRRAGLPLYRSQGFHPKAMMSFGPSLPVGVSSLAEYVDIKLRANEVEELVARDLLDRLARVTVDGVQFFGAAVLGPHDPALSRVIDEVEYVAGLPRDTLLDLGVTSREELAEMLARSRCGDLRTVRRIKGTEKTIDVAEFLADAVAGEGATELSAAGLGGELLPLRLRLRLTLRGTARAAEALTTLLGRDEVGALVARTAVFGSPAGQRAAPLVLAALRKTRAPAHADPAAAPEAVPPGS